VGYYSVADDMGLSSFV